MLKRYEQFLQDLDIRLDNYFSEHKKYLHCHKGCSECCEIGEYPFSRLEAEYIMSGFIKLPPETQKIIKQNIEKLKKLKLNSTSKRFTYRCPFLLDKKCALYKYRAIVCRTFGLAYISNNKVILPECVNSQKNYSSVYLPDEGEIIIDDPIEEDLRIDKILRNSQSEKYQLECGEIRPLIDWFILSVDSSY